MPTEFNIVLMNLASVTNCLDGIGKNIYFLRKCSFQNGFDSRPRHVDRGQHIA